MVLTLMIVGLSIGVLFSFHITQTWAGKQTVDYLNSNYDVAIEITSLRYSWPNHFVFTEVFVADSANSDTLIAIETLKVQLINYNSAKNNLNLGYATADNVYINMIQRESDSLFNLMNFINAFRKPGKKQKPPLKMEVPSFLLTNIRYNKLQPDCSTCTQIRLKEAALGGNNFILDGFDVGATIENMVYTDLDRFDLKQFTGSFFWTPEKVIVDSLFFVTDNSTVRLDGEMQTDSIEGYANFLEQVQLDVRLQSPAISSQEFQMWIPQFPDFDVFQFFGQGKGTVLDFQATDLNIKLGEASHFIGNVALVDCISPEKLWINANVKQLNTLPSDIERYLFQFYDSLPDFDYVSFGPLSLKGNYYGTIENFNADGQLISNYGDLSGEVVLSEVKDFENIAYEGRLNFNNFNMALFTGEKRFGKMSALGVVKGVGINKEYLRTLIDLRVSKIEFNKYAYQNIMVNGFVADRQFTGKMVAKDPNFDFDFDGKVLFLSDSIEFDFKAELYHANLSALNFSNSTKAICSGKAKIDFGYSESLDWLGTIALDEIQYADSSNIYFFNQIDFRSEISKQKKYFSVSSDLFDATLEGDFHFDELLDGVNYVVNSVYPHYSSPKTPPQFDVSLDIKVKSADLLYKLFFPDFYASRNTELRMEIDTRKGNMAARLIAPEISWKNHEWLQVAVASSGPLKQLQSQFEFQKYQHRDFQLGNLILQTQQIGDTTQFSFSDAALMGKQPTIDLTGTIAFLEGESLLLKLQPGEFQVAGSTFRLDKENTLSVEENRVEVTDFSLTQNSGKLSLNGIISKNPYEVLRVSLENMPTDIFNGLLDLPSLLFDGAINGQLIGSDIFQAPKFFANLQVDSLKINQDYIGDLIFESFWNIEEGRVTFGGNTAKGEEETIKFDGYFLPQEGKEILITAGFNRFEVGFLDPIFKSIFSDIEGLVNGRFQMSGPISKPYFESSLELASLQLKIPYLNTSYRVEGSPLITVTSNEVDLGEFEIRDTELGTKGRASGFLTHRTFRDFQIDVRVISENLLALNTTVSNDNYYYGRAFANGFVDITGTPENLAIRMDATSTGDSRITIPLDNPIEVSQQSFINFVNHTDTITKSESPITGLEGVALDLSLNMTPSALVTLQLDPTAGGAITGRGNGRIRLLLDQSDELEMFGNYQIESGEYQFVLQRIINKPFQVAQGSSISWNGDPFNALLDLRAVYSTRTSLTGVVTNSAYQGNRVNVDLNLLLSGLLLNTDIQFDIQLPQSDPAFQEELNSRFNDPDKLNEQAFSLLVYNSFFDPGLGAGGNIGNLAGTALGANAMQGLSAQFSNFLNKGTGDWVDINVAYNPGGVNTSSAEDPLLQSQEEIAVDVSRQFFDNRVIINSVFDVPVGANPNRLAGNISVEYKITPDGRIRTKFFNRSNLDNPYVDQLAPYSQGVGIFYRKDFDAFRIWNFIRAAQKPEEEEAISRPSTEN